MAAHFGDMLLERRRAMGLSIQQVANTIKIRPQIIEYFETENLAAMPPRGYAQGMISSYARYLGLNPRVVVDAYFDCLNAYERGLGTGARRRQDIEPDASPRSANATGRFLMVNGVPSSSRYAQRPPQAGYVAEGNSQHQPVAASKLRPLPMAGRGTGGNRARGGDDTFPNGYGASQQTGRIPRQGVNPNRPAVTGMVSARRPPYRAGAPSRGGSYDRERVRSDRFRGQSPASAQPGQRQCGRNGAVPPRRGAQGRGAGANRAPQLDPRVLIALIVGMALIVILLAMLVLRGCAPASNAAAGGSTPKAQTAAKASDSSSQDGTTDASDATASGVTEGATAGDAATAAGDATATAAEPQETKVKVSIPEEGAVAFLEVKLDGKSVLGAQEVGPFEQEFTVTQQIEITTDKPSDVTVTKNGEKVRYDMKVSGVAKVTIVAPQPEPAPDDAAADGGDAQGADAANGSDSSDSTQQQ